MKRWGIIVVAIVAALLSFVGLPKWESMHLWSSYSTDGDTLFAFKVTTIKWPGGIPIPEPAEPRILAEHFRLLAIDLRGRNDLRPVGNAELVPSKQSAPADYEYIEVRNGGLLRLWGRAALWERLRSMERISCAESDPSDVRYDEQDSRVLYLLCRSEHLAYRFVPPYREGCEIRFGDSVGLPNDSARPPRFFSLVGESAVFIDTGAGLYLVDQCARWLTGTRTDFWPNDQIFAFKGAARSPI